MGVEVVGYPPLRRKAMASADGFVLIGDLADSREKRTVLEHEKQHYRLAAFYTLEDAPQERRRSEARVHRALIHSLCPAERLDALLRRGLSLHEIALELDVTEKLVEEAFFYYRSQDPSAFCGPEG